MSQDHSGGCHCGALRYRVQATLDDVAHCHCSICRRCSGGTITTWATVPLDSFTWTRGKPRSYHSSATCTRYFCPNCGAQLALFTTRSPDSIDITIATLDDPDQVAVRRHIWVGTRLPWLHLDPQLPEEREENY